MDRENRNTGRGRFQFYLILGIFIAAVILGLVFCFVFFRSGSRLFWVYVPWTAFYAMAIWCWVDEKRKGRFEFVMGLIIFGGLFIFMLFLAIGGLTVFIPKIRSGEDVLVNILGMILGEASIAAFAYITYRFELKERIRYLMERLSRP